VLIQNVNLFLGRRQMAGSTCALNIQRYPFDIRPDGEKLGVFIDENSKLIADEGEALFTEAGEPTDFLKNRQAIFS